MLEADWRTAAYYRDPPGTKARAKTWPESDPVPEVLSTDPIPDDAPGRPAAVAALEAFAASHGWLVRVGYSRGPERAVRTGTYKMTETFAVWAAAHPSSGWRFCAVYGHTIGSTTPWAWRSIAIWKARAYGRFNRATITDLYHFVEHHADVKQAWFRAIQRRVELQAEETRRKARERPKKAKEGSS
jgi:hypothetical protein